MKNQVIIRGYVEEICFSDPEIGLVIAIFREEHVDARLKISGFNLPRPYGDLLELTGEWLRDVEAGQQFRVSQVEVLEYAALFTTIRHLRAVVERNKAGGDRKENEMVIG